MVVARLRPAARCVANLTAHRTRTLHTAIRASQQQSTKAHNPASTDASHVPENQSPTPQGKIEAGTYSGTNA